MKADKGAVEVFVRQTLGCACPDEVFRHVECEEDALLPGGAFLRSRINIGNRLLIYVVEVSDSAELGSMLGELVRSGKKERDERGFNRLRIVLAGDDAEGLRKPAEEIFGEIGEEDEKVHLHVIDAKTIDF